MFQRSGLFKCVQDCGRMEDTLLIVFIWKTITKEQSKKSLVDSTATVSLTLVLATNIMFNNYDTHTSDGRHDLKTISLADNEDGLVPQPLKISTRYAVVEQNQHPRCAVYLEADVLRLEAEIKFY